MTEDKDRRGLPLRIVLVLLSGAVVSLCFPSIGWWPLLLVVFPLLFWATTNTTPTRAFYLGQLQGLVGYGITLRWFYHIFSVAAVPLYFILTFFTGLFCLLLNHFSKKVRSGALLVLLVATLWTAVEFYRSELFFLRFPWISAGSALGPTFLSPILGVYGTSFLIVAASAGFLRRRTVPLALILSICVLCLGLFRPDPVEPDANESVAVAAVQSESCRMSVYTALSRTLAPEDVDLMVWPEYAVPYDVRQHPADFAALTNLCAELNSVLVAGTKTVIGSGFREWRNTALTLNQSGALGEYYKARPVHFFDDGIAGDDFSPVQTGLGCFATPICFDCDYSDVARKMVRLGAEFFAVPSFDNQSWTVDQHLQHSVLFRLRAAENGRWLVCAASSGVSQIVDPHGQVHASLPPMESGVISGRIDRIRHKTFFTRVGWLFPWLTLSIAVILLLYEISGHVIRRVIHRSQP